MSAFLAERVENPLLRSMSQGGMLHRLAVAAGRFDAVLLPSTAMLAEVGLTADVLCSPMMSSSSISASPPGGSTAATPHPMQWFLLSHLIALDNYGLGPDFTTLAGHRGSFSEDLKTVGRGGLIGRRRVLAHLDPLPALSHEAHATLAPEALNVFIIDGFMTDVQVITEVLAKVRSASLQQPTPSITSTTSPDATSSGSNPRAGTNSISRLWESTWTAFSSSSAPNGKSQGGQSSQSQEPSTKKAQQHDDGIQYTEFQRLMRIPESANIAQSLSVFVDHLLLYQDTSSHKSSTSVAGNAASAKLRQAPDAATIAKEVHAFTSQLMSRIHRTPVWKGKETIALEGMEKYICSKVYSKLFATSWNERQRDATLKRKLSLLNVVITPHHLDGLDGVEMAPEWVTAIASLKQINEFRSPRDKFALLSKACSSISRCIVFARTPRDEGAKHVDEDDGSSGDRVSSTTSIVGLGGADDFLPSLLLCVLRSNPELLHCNVSYMELFRNKNLMEPSDEYHLTSLQSSAEFWLTCQAAHLRLTQEEFDLALGNVFATPSSPSRPATTPVPILDGGLGGFNEAGTSSSSSSVIDRAFGIAAAPQQAVRAIEVSHVDPLHRLGDDDSTARRAVEEQLAALSSSCTDVNSLEARLEAIATAMAISEAEGKSATDALSIAEVRELLLFAARQHKVIKATRMLLRGADEKKLD